MILAKRNDWRESEGQQVARCLWRLKPQLRGRIGVQVVRDLTEAKNMVMKAELLLQENHGYNISCSKVSGLGKLRTCETF